MKLDFIWLILLLAAILVAIDNNTRRIQDLERRTTDLEERITKLEKNIVPVITVTGKMEVRGAENKSRVL